jgi:hypothetical protein
MRGRVTGGASPGGKLQRNIIYLSLSSNYFPYDYDIKRDDYIV